MLLASALWAVRADAQHPVCPQPSASHIAYSACPQGGGRWVARLLTDLAVDHAFKPMPPPLKLMPAELLEVLALKEIASDPRVSAFVDDLEPFAFTKLDTSTGVFETEIVERRRRFRWMREGWTTRYRFSGELPLSMAGGYWRTPGVLQMAFWEGHRVRFKIETESSVQLSMKVACVSIAPEGVRLVPARSRRPQVMISFVGCK